MLTLFARIVAMGMMGVAAPHAAPPPAPAPVAVVAPVTTTTTTTAPVTPTSIVTFTGGTGMTGTTTAASLTPAPAATATTQTEQTLTKDACTVTFPTGHIKPVVTEPCSIAFSKYAGYGDVITVTGPMSGVAQT